MRINGRSSWRGVGNAVRPPGRLHPGPGTTVVIVAANDDSRSGAAPMEQPLRVGLDQPDASVARRASRQRVFMEAVASGAIEVEIPRHDPCIIERADPDARVPVQMVAARWR